MFDIPNHTSFVLAILVFQLVPGPGTIAILNATARNGTAAGMAAVAGTLAGDFVFMAAAVAGLAAVDPGEPAALRGAAVVRRGVPVLDRHHVAAPPGGPAALAEQPKRSAWSSSGKLSR